MSRASLHAGSARSTLLWVNLCNSCFRIYLDSIKITSSLTVATAKTAVTTSCISRTGRVHGSTCAQTIIDDSLRTKGTCASTSYYCHFRLTVSDSHAEKVSYLTHTLSSTNRTVESLNRACVSTFHQCVSHSRASRESASSAVCLRQNFCDLCDSWIFLDSKFLGTHEQNSRCYERNNSQGNHCR